MREEIIFGNAPTLEHILDALSEIETIVNAKQRERQFEARCRLKDFGYQPHRLGMFPDITCDKISVNPLKQGFVDRRHCCHSQNHQSPTTRSKKDPWS